MQRRLPLDLNVLIKFGIAILLFSFLACDNLQSASAQTVADNSFESPVVSGIYNRYEANPTGTSWTFTGPWHYGQRIHVIPAFCSGWDSICLPWSNILASCVN